jgi:hypothetical protein
MSLQPNVKKEGSFRVSVRRLRRAEQKALRNN